MPLNLQLVTLESELADLDEQLQSLDGRTHFSKGQIVLCRRYLQHRRQKVFLQIEVVRATQVIESCERDVEVKQKQREWAKTPDGRKILEKKEMRRLAGCLDGGTHKTYTPFDRLKPEQRAIEIAEGDLGRAEDTLRNAKTNLSHTTTQLLELRAQDDEWEALSSQRFMSAESAAPWGVAERAMKYPSDFPPGSRATVETEKIRAGRDFDSAKQLTRWTSALETQLRQYILRIFLAFAKEAKALRLWPVDKMDSECREFLRLLTINAHYQKGYDKAGRRLPDMISHWDGSILPEAERQFEKAAEWRQYQDLLLEMADVRSEYGGQILSNTESKVSGNDHVAPATKARSGRPARLAPHFVEIAGRSWLKAKRPRSHSKLKSKVTHSDLVTIASRLDSERYIPPADYLEKGHAAELRSYNSRNSNSQTGAIKTWTRLVALADKDHMRGMRRLLSRCAAKLASRGPRLSGN